MFPVAGCSKQHLHAGAGHTRSLERICGSSSRNPLPNDPTTPAWLDLDSSTSVGAAEHPGEVPTQRALSYRDGYLPALRFEVVPKRCRQRRGHVPGEHQIVLFRGERDAGTVGLLPIHLQQVGTMGDVLEGTSSTTAGLAASSWRRSAAPWSAGASSSGANRPVRLPGPGSHGAVGAAPPRRCRPSRSAWLCQPRVAP